MKAYPLHLPPRYNGSTTPCDMLVGPCCCGAWHMDEEVTMSEAAITHAICKRLAAMAAGGDPVWVYKVHGGGWAKAGIPDLLVVVAGRAVFLEIKAGRNKASKIQEVRIKQIRAAGGVAVVVRSVTEAVEVVESVLAAAR